jgi:phosphate starvation-inducible protein PhoH and related proteins
LRDDVVFVVQSLGGVVNQRTRKAAGRKPGLARGRPVYHRSDAHTLDIRLPEGVVPFRLARKAAKYDATGGGRPMRFIDRIEPAGTAEAVCIRVAAADSLYVTEDFLLTHNTLNYAFIVLDEAQNTTAEQMKMFLTRLGFGSKMVVTGDVTQVDLPGGATSGLRAAVDILDGIDGIHVSELTSADVVRHRLVSEIVDAYARAEDPSLSMNRAQRRAAGSRAHRAR